MLKGKLLSILNHLDYLDDTTLRPESVLLLEVSGSIFSNTTNFHIIKSSSYGRVDVS